MKSDWPSKIFWGTGSGLRKTFKVEGVAIKNIFENFAAVPPKIHRKSCGKGGPRNFYVFWGVALENILHVGE